MQKQKIDTIYYIALQNSYEEIDVALFNKELLISKKNISKIKASAELVLTLDALLKENNLNLSDLTFIAVNEGPGPFTTLRVVIATVNAINFAKGIPLVGIDGINAFVQEYQDSNYPVVAILNAFNNDVYYAINSKDNITEGWKNIELFLQELKAEFPDQKIKFIGNGINLFKKEIEENFKDFGYIPENYPKMPSIEYIAKVGYKNWENKKGITKEVMPLYLKDAIKK